MNPPLDASTRSASRLQHPLNALVARPENGEKQMLRTDMRIVDSQSQRQSAHKDVTGGAREGGGKGGLDSLRSLLDGMTRVTEIDGMQARATTPGVCLLPSSPSSKCSGPMTPAPTSIASSFAASIAVRASSLNRSITRRT